MTQKKLFGGNLAYVLINNLTIIKCFSGEKECNNYAIPEGITEIESEAFGGCQHIASIRIPKSVAIIGGGAFRDFTSLRELHLHNEHPENMVIGEDAFANLKDCTLFVPIGTGYAYRHDEHFSKYFKEVKIER